MSRPVLEPSLLPLEDARAFAALVDSHPFFDPSREIVIARAPGRLDVMGGIADYSGSLVLQWPLREATLVAVQATGDDSFEVSSLASECGGSAERVFQASIRDLFPDGTPLAYEAAQSWFAEHPESRWAGYVLGALIVLAREKSLQVSTGLRILIRSDVPEGKGVSSSAALEVSTMQALSALLHLGLDPREVALLSQIVENRIVGAACGVMDQMTASCGGEGELLSLLCQPAELRDPLALPEGLEFFGLDSGVRHSVSGSDYTSVRVAAFMGARILEQEIPRLGERRVHRYLVSITPSEFDAVAPRVLPEVLRGGDFLDKYGQTSDTVTRPDPDRDYAVRAATAHPVHEHFRVRTFARLLHGAPSEEVCDLLGELMYQSHASYSACGLGSDATDSLVEMVREAGPSHGFFGAKITGGGSGGTVAVLARKGASIDRIADEFALRSGRRPRIFTGSSPGAAAFGWLRQGPVERP
jgi:L-arabinokinase